MNLKLNIKNNLLVLIVFFKILKKNEYHKILKPLFLTISTIRLFILFIGGIIVKANAFTYIKAINWIPFKNDFKKF